MYISVNHIARILTTYRDSLKRFFLKSKKHPAVYMNLTDKLRLGVTRRIDEEEFDLILETNNDQILLIQGLPMPTGYYKLLEGQRTVIQSLADHMFSIMLAELSSDQKTLNELFTQYFKSNPGAVDSLKDCPKIVFEERVYQGCRFKYMNQELFGNYQVRVG